MSGTLLCLFIILCGLVRAQRGLEVATQREQSTSSSGGRNTENMTINWKTNYVSDLKSVDVYSSFISCIHCLQIQTLWRFYRDSTPYVKSSSWWVTDVLPWTWPARRRKVGLTIHLTAATPKVSYCGFMIAFLKTRPFVIFFFPLNFQNDLVIHKTVSAQDPLARVFGWFPPNHTGCSCTGSLLLQMFQTLKRDGAQSSSSNICSYIKTEQASVFDTVKSTTKQRVD